MTDKKKNIWILTIFPDYFNVFFSQGIAARAFSRENFAIHLLDLRNFAPGSYKSVDDYPFGGGPGMIMRADILKRALWEGIIVPSQLENCYKDKLHVVYTGPRGRTFNNKIACEFAEKYLIESSDKDLVFLCGRYEGVDERFLPSYVDEEISIGDYVLTGGELAVEVILDASVRFVKETLGNPIGASQESFEGSLLEDPQYTRPQEFEGQGVPEILLSGHHKNIEKYRQAERERITKQHRPDLYEEYLRSKIR